MIHLDSTELPDPLALASDMAATEQSRNTLRTLLAQVLTVLGTGDPFRSLLLTRGELTDLADALAHTEEVLARRACELEIWSHYYPGADLS